MAPILRFRAVCKRKRPAPSLLKLCYGTDVARRNFTSPSTEDKKKQWWWGWGLIFFCYLHVLFKCVLFSQLFDSALPLWSSSGSWLAMFHSRRCSYNRTGIPRQRRVFTVRLSIDVAAHSNSASKVVIFPPGTPVTNFLSQPTSTVIPVALAFKQTKQASLLPHSSIAVITKASKRTPQTSLCRLEKRPQRCFLPFGQNRPTIWSKPSEAYHFFLNEQGPRVQAASNELTKNTPQRYAKTATSAVWLSQMRKNENEVGRIYVLGHWDGHFGTHIWVPWQWSGLSKIDKTIKMLAIVWFLAQQLKTDFNLNFMQRLNLPNSTGSVINVTFSHYIMLIKLQWKPS